jgi:hypothetical protein
MEIEDLKKELHALIRTNQITVERTAETSPEIVNIIRVKLMLMHMF